MFGAMAALTTIVALGRYVFKLNKYTYNEVKIKLIHSGVFLYCDTQLSIKICKWKLNHPLFSHPWSWIFYLFIWDYPQVYTLSNKKELSKLDYSLIYIRSYIWNIRVDLRTCMFRFCLFVVKKTKISHIQSKCDWSGRVARLADNDESNKVLYCYDVFRTPGGMRDHNFQYYQVTRVIWSFMRVLQ